MQLTREDYGLGSHFYHSTSKAAALKILNEGLSRGFLATEEYIQDALDYAQTEIGLEAVTLEITLPRNWPLERVETGIYISNKHIPRRLIREYNN